LQPFWLNGEWSDTLREVEERNIFVSPHWDASPDMLPWITPQAPIKPRIAIYMLQAGKIVVDGI
jgi:hypothetical protein